QLARPQPAHHRVEPGRIGPGRADEEHHLGAEHVRRRAHHAAAFGVRGVREAGGGTGAGLDEDLMTGLAQPVDLLRNERDAALSWRGLAYHPDPHRMPGPFWIGAAARTAPPPPPSRPELRRTCLVLPPTVTLPACVEWGSACRGVSAMSVGGGVGYTVTSRYRLGRGNRSAATRPRFGQMSL